MIYYIDADGFVAGSSEVALSANFYAGCERVEHELLPAGEYTYGDGVFTEVIPESPPSSILEQEPVKLTAVQYKGWLGVDRYIEVVSLQAVDPKVSYYVDLMNESFASQGYIEASHPLTLEGLAYLQGLSTEHLATVLDEFKAEMGVKEK